MAFNLESGIAGGLAGAGTGAAIGSVVPGIGTGVGAVGGGILGLLSGLLSGDASPEQIRQFEQFTPEQKQAFSSILQMAMQQMQSPQQGFEPIAQEATRQYQQEGVPSLAERFSGLGAGSQRSSAFTGELAKGEAGLRSQLAALGAQYGQRQQGIAQNLAALGLTPQFSQALQQRTPGAFESSLPAVLQGLGSVGGQYFKSKFNQQQLGQG